MFVSTCVTKWKAFIDDVLYYQQILLKTDNLLEVRVTIKISIVFIMQY